MPPQPHVPSGGVINATVLRSECIQGGARPGTDMSEDCLFLNIATPVTALSGGPTKLPVMICEFCSALGQGE